MAGVQEHREAVVETPEKLQRPGRTKTFRVFAIAVAAVVAIGFAWLLFRDSGDETPIEESIVSATANPTDEALVGTEDSIVSATTDPTDEALVGTNVELPFGWFENRDSGMRIVVLHEDGTYTFNNQGFPVNGAYEVEGDLFTVLTEDVDPQSDSGTYHWTFEDGILKFTVVEDPVRWRSAFITYPFVLVE